MAIDFLHTGELVDAVIAVLKGADGAAHTGGLPANWFADGAARGECPLLLLEHGDLSDYGEVADLRRDLPAVIVRGLGPQPTTEGGAGGVDETDEMVRVVHVRTFGQCYTDAGVAEDNHVRARERYAKLLHRALFNDPHRRLAVIASDGTRTIPTLTCTDGAGAQIVRAAWHGTDLGHDGANPNAIEDVALLRHLRARIWAIAVDLRVSIRSGGQT